MKKYRIVKRPQYGEPHSAMYEVQRKGWFFWHDVYTTSIEQWARERAEELTNEANPLKRVKKEVIWESHPKLYTKAELPKLF